MNGGPPKRVYQDYIMNYAHYRIDIPRCTRPSLVQRRLDVVVDRAYADMLVFTGDPQSITLKFEEHALVELELYECDGQEHKVAVKEFAAGQTAANDPGDQLTTTFVQMIELPDDDLGDLEWAVDELDRGDDDFDHGWPMLAPNPYGSFDDDGDDLLIGAVL